MPCFSPLLWGNEVEGDLILNKKETYPFSSKWAAFSEFGEHLWVLQNSKLSVD